MSAPLDKAKNIRLLILDVDGVLTSGSVFYTNDDNERKVFHVHDGMGIKLLIDAGIQVALISGRKSPVVEKRVQELGIVHAYLGFEHKIPPYEELKNKLNLTDADIAYMGDDLPDLPLLKRAGLAISVPNAPHYIKDQVDIVTTKHGGDGAVREICEYLLTAQDKFNAVVDSFKKQ